MAPGPRRACKSSHVIARVRRHRPGSRPARFDRNVITPSSLFLTAARGRAGRNPVPPPSRRENLRVGVDKTLQHMLGSPFRHAGETEPDGTPTCTVRSATASWGKSGCSRSGRKSATGIAMTSDSGPTDVITAIDRWCLQRSPAGIASMMQQLGVRHASWRRDQSESMAHRVKYEEVGFPRSGETTRPPAPGGGEQSLSLRLSWPDRPSASGAGNARCGTAMRAYTGCATSNKSWNAAPGNGL